VLVCELLLAAPPYPTAKQIMCSLRELSCSSTSHSQRRQFRAITRARCSLLFSGPRIGGLKCTAVPELRHTPNSLRVALQSAGKCKSTHPPYTHCNVVVVIMTKADCNGCPILTLSALSSLREAAHLVATLVKRRAAAHFYGVLWQHLTNCRRPLLPTCAPQPCAVKLPALGSCIAAEHHPLPWRCLGQPECQVLQARKHF
jgi:hypothetical protein